MRTGSCNKHIHIVNLFKTPLDMINGTIVLMNVKKFVDPRLPWKF